jgi:hypothetical protein
MPSLTTLLPDASMLVIYLIAVFAVMAGSILFMGALLLRKGGDNAAEPRDRELRRPPV